MTFGDALEELKQGRHVAREGWNGKGMHVEANYDIQFLGAFLMLQSPAGNFNTWVPSISDLFAEDWVIVK